MLISLLFFKFIGAFSFKSPIDSRLLEAYGDQILQQIINIITDIDILRFISYKHAIWIIIIPPAASFCYQLDGIFIGASQTKEMRNAMMVSVASFIVISIYLTKYYDNHGLWLSLLLFMLLRSLTLNYFFDKILKKF